MDQKAKKKTTDALLHEGLNVHATALAETNPALHERLNIREQRTGVVQASNSYQQQDSGYYYPSSRPAHHQYPPVSHHHDQYGNHHSYGNQHLHDASRRETANDIVNKVDESSISSSMAEDVDFDIGDEKDNKSFEVKDDKAEAKSSHALYKEMNASATTFTLNDDEQQSLPSAPPAPTPTVDGSVKSDTSGSDKSFSEKSGSKKSDDEPPSVPSAPPVPTPTVDSNDINKSSIDSGTVSVCSKMSEISTHDVLCVSGGIKIHNHVGNHNFRSLVQEFLSTYGRCKQGEKSRIARTIVLIIRKRGGRFLGKDKKDGKFYEIGDHKAESKTMQAFGRGLKQQDEKDDTTSKVGDQKAEATTMEALRTVMNTSTASGKRKRKEGLASSVLNNDDDDTDFQIRDENNDDVEEVNEKDNKIQESDSIIERRKSLIGPNPFKINPFKRSVSSDIENDSARKKKRVMLGTGHIVDRRKRRQKHKHPSLLGEAKDEVAESNVDPSSSLGELLESNVHALPGEKIDSNCDDDAKDEVAESNVDLSLGEVMVGGKAKDAVIDSTIAASENNNMNESETDLKDLNTKIVIQNVTVCTIM